MQNIQIVLNAILSKNIFEYILIDKNLCIVHSSKEIERYICTVPLEGDEILNYLPELVGFEKEIKKIFSQPTLLCELESIYKNEYYVNISVEYYNENIVLILLQNITDVTRSRQKLLQYSNESILLNKTFEKILNRQNALLFVTYNNEISYTNEQFMAYFDLKITNDTRRKNLQLYKYFDVRINSYDALFEKLNSKEEYIIINKDTFILQATLVETTHKLFTLTKVTKLSNKMHLDTLTGIYKKSYFNIHLEKLITHNKQALVVVIDIDNFKLINDEYGHQAGDDVLKEFATLLHKNIRANDILARWGGEEFLLLFEGKDIENTIKKVESLRVLIETYIFKHVGHMTSSFGMAGKEDNDDVYSLLHRADKALYEAKNSGKNRVVFKKN